MPSYVCATCGTRFPETRRPPRGCPVCEDVRQFVPPEGQRWLEPAELASTHANRVQRHEADLYGIGTEPRFAIGQRALLVRTPEGNLLWDCISLLDERTISWVHELGGLRGIAISHPHFYASMRAWARAFDVPVHLHQADRDWVMDPGPELRHGSGERLTLFGGLTLIRTGGHFPGSTVLHWPQGADGKGALLTGDSLQVVPDREVVSFMYSYPNHLPLPADTVISITKAVLEVPFDRIYGGWWERCIPTGAQQTVTRGRDRYLAALAGRLPGQDR
ncbi:MAG: hypothetical protein U5K81_09165 [Trueperaceae bacterium]|nr:hypothetical protein [Trueperaceae bacterium]